MIPHNGSRAQSVLQSAGGLILWEQRRLVGWRCKWSFAEHNNIQKTPPSPCYLISNGFVSKDPWSHVELSIHNIVCKRCFNKEKMQRHLLSILWKLLWNIDTFKVWCVAEWITGRGEVALLQCGIISLTWPLILIYHSRKSSYHLLIITPGTNY